LHALTIWRFGGPDAAATALPGLAERVEAGRVEVDDVALVSWPPGHRKPSTRSLGALTGPGALWGGFWGMLMGLVFLTPLAGPTFGAAAGAVAGTLSDFGVEDDFVKRARDTVTPGTSALFVISSDRGVDQFTAALDGREFCMLRTDLTQEQARQLYAALGEESASRVGG
jgi:uncharacterized membrane protein